MITEDDGFERIEREQKYWRDRDRDRTRYAAVATDYYWLPIDEDTPAGVKVLLLGRSGVATMGHYEHRPGETQFWTHWAPLPKKPA